MLGSGTTRTIKKRRVSPPFPGIASHRSHWPGMAPASDGHYFALALSSMSCTEAVVIGW